VASAGGRRITSSFASPFGTSHDRDQADGDCVATPLLELVLAAETGRFTEGATWMGPGSAPDCPAVVPVVGVRVAVPLLDQELSTETGRLTDGAIWIGPIRLADCGDVGLPVPVPVPVRVQVPVPEPLPGHAGPGDRYQRGHGNRGCEPNVGAASRGKPRHGW
jgi:hypothetical protein